MTAVVPSRQATSTASSSAYGNGGKGAPQLKPTRARGIFGFPTTKFSLGSPPGDRGLRATRSMTCTDGAYKSVCRWIRYSPPGHFRAAKEKGKKKEGGI